MASPSPASHSPPVESEAQTQKSRKESEFRNPNPRIPKEARIPKSETIHAREKTGARLPDSRRSFGPRPSDFVLRISHSPTLHRPPRQLETFNLKLETPLPVGRASPRAEPGSAVAPTAICLAISATPARRQCFRERGVPPASYSPLIQISRKLSPVRKSRVQRLSSTAAYPAARRATSLKKRRLLAAACGIHCFKFKLGSSTRIL